jgi:uncharacterized membrane-anchored protein
MTTIPASSSRLPAWRLWLPLLLQTALIAAIPAQAVYTHWSGRTVILQTAPVDPYDLLRGYSQTLGYTISDTNTLKSLPGWNTLPKMPGNPAYLADNSSLYVTLEAPAASNQGRPKPWKPVAVNRDRPSSLKPNQVVLKGRANYNRIEYGLETYYMPEDQREEINATITQTQRRQPGVVEIKVDAQGNAVPVSLWVGDRNYRF